MSSHRNCSYTVDSLPSVPAEFSLGMEAFWSKEEYDYTRSSDWKDGFCAAERIARRTSQSASILRR